MCAQNMASRWFALAVDMTTSVWLNYNKNKKIINA